MDGDTRFIYLDEHTAVRICNITGVGVYASGNLRVFTTDNTEYGYKVDTVSFNKIFGTNYSDVHIKNHIVELFIGVLDEGVINRPKYKAECPIQATVDGKNGFVCPVC